MHARLFISPFTASCPRISIICRFSRLHLITAVLIEGRALGGGAELTTAADFRLMAHNAKVEFVHMRMGVLPAWGGTTRLTRLVGESAQK